MLGRGFRPDFVRHRARSRAGAGDPASVTGPWRRGDADARPSPAPPRCAEGRTAAAPPSPDLRESARFALAKLREFTKATRARTSEFATFSREMALVPSLHLSTF